MRTKDIYTKRLADVLWAVSHRGGGFALVYNVHIVSEDGQRSRSVFTFTRDDGSDCSHDNLSDAIADAYLNGRVERHRDGIPVPLVELVDDAEELVASKLQTLQ